MRCGPVGSGCAALSALLFLLGGRGGYAAVISAPDQAIVPGQTAVASIMFSSQAQTISGFQFDMTWDSALDVKAIIGDSLRTSSKLLYQGSLGDRAARYLLIGMNGDIVPDGEVLKLFIIVNGSAPTGMASIRVTNAIAVDPPGNPVPLASPTINVQIQQAVTAAAQQPNSTWSTPFTQVTLPAAITKTEFGIRGAAVGPDGYAYVGSAAGLYRAAMSCIAANPGNVSCWSAINNGAPPAYQGSDPYLAATSFDFVGSKVVVGWVDALTGHYGRVCSWDSLGQTWACNKPQTPDPFLNGMGAVTHDAGNNLYSGGSTIFKSTDGGLTWVDQTKGDAYGSIGLTTGFIYDIRVWGGSIYWGGEGPLIKQPLNFASFQNLLPTANGGCSDPNCYAHNMRGTIADGNAAAGAQSELLALMNHCSSVAACVTGSGYIQRLSVANNTWSPAADAAVPGAGSSLFWTVRRLAQGYTPHEYYAVGGAAGGLTGVMGSMDGGATWALLGNGQTWSSPTNDSSMSFIGVSPIDDSKLVARQGDVWFQPGPPSPPPLATLAQNALLNAASLLPGPIAPGEIVTYFGAVPVSPALLFNGASAPILYAGSNQLNAIVPFGLDVTSPVTVALQNNGQTVSSGTFSTAAFAPAIFAQNGSGIGLGAILNQDYVSNSASSPAAAGSVIMVYGTGFGSIIPTPADGKTVNSTASTFLPVSASIAGVPATVLYAGAAPGLVAGMDQINILVPAGVGRNPAAPLLLSIGSAMTQPGLTVSIQ